MSKSLAVAVIHGMGSQTKKDPDDTAKLTFSKDLHKRIRREIGAQVFDKHIAWREIFWAHTLQERQEKYIKKITNRTNLKKIRSFVMYNLSDAASYRKTASDKKDHTYENIHKRIQKTLLDLRKDVEAGTPLILLAHSLGGHILSNYIYDIQKTNPQNPDPFLGLRTVPAFITFGCNIPVFTFAYKDEDIYPITYPGVNLPKAIQLKPWWYNFFDRDDVLGYPLGPTSTSYETMVKKKELRDIPINSGNILTSWNPFSHNGYWKDDDFYRPVSRIIKRYL